jgi:hypothetical protein
MEEVEHSVALWAAMWSWDRLEDASTEVGVGEEAATIVIGEPGERVGHPDEEGDEPVATLGESWSAVEEAMVEHVGDCLGDLDQTLTWHGLEGRLEQLPLGFATDVPWSKQVEEDQVGEEECCGLVGTRQLFRELLGEGAPALIGSVDHPADEVS